MAKEKKVYLNFPITLIPPIYKGKDVVKAIDDIIMYGIVAYCVGKNKGYEDALEEMGITSKLSYEEQKKAYDKAPKTSVFTSIEKGKAFAFRDAQKSYKDNKDEIMALCGELAVRSIVGVKDYAKCFRGLVLSRMAGFAKGVQEDWYPDAVKKLAGDGGKRQWRKLIASLRYAGCSIYTPKGCHGFYASFRLSPVELAEKVERKKREADRRKTEYDLSNEELRKMALERIGRTP